VEKVEEDWVIMDLAVDNWRSGTSSNWPSFLPDQVWEKALDQ
jgi:hypothetical protein